jgi:RimJ/RimL family protein N-acetyltransferase
MELQPTLNGKLLALRPLTLEDFENLFAVANDPLIWEQHPETTRYRRDVFQLFFAKAIESRGALVIVDAATARFIGSSRYYDYSPEQRSVFVGYTFLARKYWGGVYNRELKNLMLAHAFQHVDRVMFHVGEKNFRSQKALLKIGAERFGEVIFPGESAPTPIFKIDRKQ